MWIFMKLRNNRLSFEFSIILPQTNPQAQACAFVALGNKGHGITAIRRIEF
jgi:hypothetical protein